MQHEIDQRGQAIIEKTLLCMGPVPISRLGLEAIAEGAKNASGEAFEVFRDYQTGLPLDVDCIPPSSQGHALFKRGGADGVVIVFA